MTNERLNNVIDIIIYYTKEKITFLPLCLIVNEIVFYGEITWNEGHEIKQMLYDNVTMEDLHRYEPYWYPYGDYEVRINALNNLKQK